MVDVASSSSDEFVSVFRRVLDSLCKQQDESLELSNGSGAGVSASAEAVETLDDILGRQDLQCLMELHQLVSAHQLRRSRVSDSESARRGAEELRAEALSALRRDASPTAREVCQLLQRAHVTAAVGAFDSVRARRYEPLLPEIPHEVDEDEGLAMKIVRLVKNDEPLGATIKCEESGAVLIARVMRGGVADRSGCIQVGDRVVEVNGSSVHGKKPEQIVRLLTATNGTVTFKLIPADDDFLSAQRDDGVATATRVRALFDYSPADDATHPCPEAGLCFHKGDIIELVECRDDNWWQAQLCERDGPLSTKAVNARGPVGLIPSRELQERKFSASVDARGRRSSVRARKLMYETSESDELQSDAPHSYEQVALLYPQAALRRVVVLVGASGVGRNELKRRLLMLNADRYGTTVPHTSRPARDGETDGVDYHFSSRAQMEAWVRDGQFLEYGEYRGNLYGTLSDSVRALLGQGRVPVLSPHPQAIHKLRNAAFKPCIIIIKPPPFAALKESRTSGRAMSTFEGTYNRGFTDAELQKMVGCSEELERSYGLWFDFRMVNGNLEFAFRQLCDILQRVETEPQWVPISWVC